MYSAPQIYYDRQLAKGNTDWPISIVNAEIESSYKDEGHDTAKQMLFANLGQDYDQDTNPDHVAGRPWFGRCVWESDNDVCDDQFVTITWEDDPVAGNGRSDPLQSRGAKTATFHMIAQTEKQCERRGRIYGTKGEIEYDGTTIRVFDFGSDSEKEFHPPRRGGGHGGGDDGLAQQFLKAIISVASHGTSAEQAQIEHLGCTPEEIIRSHALVFAAEAARREKKVLDWKSWWTTRVEMQLSEMKQSGGAKDDAGVS